MKKVAVLLSAYNGENYINEQIESICCQTYSPLRLYVRDDGSNQQFTAQLRALQHQYQFTLIEGENLGFVKSFMTLLETVDDADFYAFADQDDIWQAEKIERAVAWFEKEVEKGNGDKPALFHSAYDVMDEKGQVTDRFYFKNEDYDFRRSITENHYSGFAMVINRKLRDMMLKGNPVRIGYHDWWAAMIVQAFGTGYSDSEALAKHRTHGDNVTTFNTLTRLRWLGKSMAEESDIHRRAMEFQRCFGEELQKENKTVLDWFCYDKYHVGKALKKSFYPKRWRPQLSSEVVMRLLMLMGRI